MAKKPWSRALAAGLIAAACRLSGQTTQGVITGRVTDLATDQAVANCEVALTVRAFGNTITRRTSPGGDYVVAPLSPGLYDLRVDCAGYQRQESHNVELGVASLLLINVRMRPLSEVWEDSYRRLMVLPDASVLTLYGPDVDLSRTSVVQALRGAPAALETTVSQTIDSSMLDEVPLSGRDAYTLLVLQPGVSSDAGTARSLALSVNGQRPSASKFLLDGLENDSPLVTGPLSPIPPEALGEFRISSNSFSAEYGRASGYISNAVTRSGTASVHGTAYGYVRHDALIAKQAIVPNGDASAPFHEIEPGVVITGPVRKKWNLFGSFAWETARLYTRQAQQTYTMPTRSFIDSLPAGNLAERWLGPYERAAPAGAGTTSTFGFAPPLHINRDVFVPRLDWANPDGTSHVMARYAGFFVDRPDFLYNPWPGFSTDLKENTHSAALAWTWLPGASISEELRVGFSVDALSDMRPHPEVPILSVTSGLALPQGVNFPSSGQGSSFANRTRSVELDEDLGVNTARHALRLGGGRIGYAISGVLTYEDIARFNFANLADFAADSPNLIQVAIARNEPLTPTLPDFYRRYSSADWYGFIQDSYRPWRRLTIDLGFRYDWFGAPDNTGATKDYLLTIPQAGDLATRISGATLNLPVGTETLYSAAHNGAAVRGGFSYSLDADGHTVIHAAAGVYTDRPFDNLWQTIRNNDYLPLVAPLSRTTRNYANVTAVLATIPSLAAQSTSNDLTTFAPGFSTPHVLDSMAGVQHSAGERLVIEGDYLGSSSGNLVSTDRLNRQYSVPSTLSNPGGRYQSALGDFIVRGSQGRSRYSAATALLRYRSPTLMSAISYTFSVSRDNQSDPVAGEFFDLGLGGGGLSPEATFIVPNNPAPNWAHSDFDRRHNFVALASWELPGWLAGFRASALGALRSGSPFTVFGTPATVSDLIGNPADLIAGESPWAGRNPVPGGVQLLNAAAFTAVSDHVGNTGRNGFYGPGLISADASLSRRFHVPRLPERVAFLIRMDAYNAFNHANLGQPDSNLNHSTFGISLRGVQTFPQAFRILAPLDDARRQIQLSLKAEF